MVDILKFLRRKMFFFYFFLKKGEPQQKQLPSTNSQANYEVKQTGNSIQKTPVLVIRPSNEGN